MSVKVIYKCDRCAAEWEKDLQENKDKQIWTIGIGISHGPSSLPAIAKSNTRQWCRKCVLDVGLITLAPKENAMRNTPQVESFEDKVAELLNYLGFEQAP